MSAESAALRIELKSWENEFQNTYGRKPTPDDIRAAGLGPFTLVVLRFGTDFDWPLAFAADKYRKWKALKKEVAAMKNPTIPPVTPQRPTSNQNRLNRPRLLSELSL
jgi:hypothetical protein